VNASAHAARRGERDGAGLIMPLTPRRRFIWSDVAFVPPRAMASLAPHPTFGCYNQFILNYNNSRIRKSIKRLELIEESGISVPHAATSAASWRAHRRGRRAAVPFPSRPHPALGASTVSTHSSPVTTRVHAMKMYFEFLSYQISHNIRILREYMLCYIRCYIYAAYVKVQLYCASAAPLSQRCSCTRSQSMCFDSFRHTRTRTQRR
jgi:hypothetical protein